MTIPAPTYITVADVKAYSRVTGLTELSDEDITFLIQTAEDQIDLFVGKQRHHPYDANVDRVFPREQDFQYTNLVQYPLIPQIPYLVSRACFAQVEFLFLEWWDDAETAQTPVQLDLESQDIGGDGSIAVKYARGGTDLSAASLCVQARNFLQDLFKSRFSQLSVSDPRGSSGLLRNGFGCDGETDPAAQLGTLSSRE